MCRVWRGYNLGDKLNIGHVLIIRRLVIINVLYGAEGNFISTFSDVPVIRICDNLGDYINAVFNACLMVYILLLDIVDIIYFFYLPSFMYFRTTIKSRFYETIIAWTLTLPS